MFGIKIQTPTWTWAKDENDVIYQFVSRQEATDKAVELGYSNYIIDVIV